MTARCKCGHLPERHNGNNRMCYGSAVCGCTSLRPDDGDKWPPARLRDEFDPSPEPVQRRPA